MTRDGHPDHEEPAVADTGFGPPYDRRRSGRPFPDTGEQRATRTIVLAFAPIHKAALGTATGLVFALILALITLVDLAIDPRGLAGLDLLAQYFYGYTVSVTGALIALGWGFVVGFVAGWFLAFARNVVMAVWILYFRARADWLATRNLLDHV